MTLQEIFDTVTRHLFTQGHKATLHSGGRCAYRGENDCKCAVGCLINDEDYSPSMEGKDTYQLRAYFPELKLGVDRSVSIHDTTYTRLLDNLQTAHDNNRNWYDTETMREALYRIAISHSLDTKLVNDSDLTLSFSDR